MGHALLLELPEEIYQPLIKTAQQSGSTPEQVATAWLVTVIRQTWQDPVEKLSVAFRAIFLIGPINTICIWGKSFYKRCKDTQR